MRRVPRVKQRDQTDCAAACLHAVGAFYGRRVSIARLRQHAGTDQHGTTVAGLVEAAEKVGLVAKGVKGPPESLAKIPKPAVAHVVTERGLQHFIVIDRVSRNRVSYMDPGDGARHRLPVAEFAARWTGIAVLFAPTERRPLRREATRLERFWHLVRPHRSVLTQAIIGAAVFTILGLASAVYIQKVVDHVLVDGNRNLLNLLSVAMLAVIGAQFVLGSLKSVILLQTGQRIDAELILGYYRHLLQLPQQFFDTMRVGELVSRVNDAVKIRAFINDVALDLVVNVCVVISAFALMLVYDWQLTLLIASLLPAFGTLYWVVNRLNRKTQRALMARGADVEAHLVESLGAIRTVKRLGGEGQVDLVMEKRFVRLLRQVSHSTMVAIGAGSSVQLLVRVGSVLLVWVGASHVLGGSLTPGELMSCYALFGYVTGPIASLITVNRTLQDALIAADRLFEILDLAGEEERTTFALPAVGDIQFEGVGYRYGTRAVVFHDLTLRFPQGSICAVVGESGSGKSTLVSLIQKIYPVTTGRILCGTTDIAQVDAASLRRLVGVVPQQIDLFSGSLLENVAFGDAVPDMGRVVRLCHALGLDAVIARLPNGVDTDLGAGGQGLSGGERQRLAIARALYRDPEVLVLDESTSALDPRSEELVHQVILQLRQRGRTILMVTHRPSVAASADRVVMLGNGGVIAEGTHLELLARSTPYASLWRDHSMAAPATQAA